MISMSYMQQLLMTMTFGGSIIYFTPTCDVVYLIPVLAYVTCKWPDQDIRLSSMFSTMIISIVTLPFTYLLTLFTTQSLLFLSTVQQQEELENLPYELSTLVVTLAACTSICDMWCRQSNDIENLSEKGRASLDAKLQEPIWRKLLTTILHGLPRNNNVKFLPHNQPLTEETDEKTRSEQFADWETNLNPFLHLWRDANLVQVIGFFRVKYNVRLDIFASTQKTTESKRVFTFVFGDMRRSRIVWKLVRQLMWNYTTSWLYMATFFNVQFYLKLFHGFQWQRLPTQNFVIYSFVSFVFSYAFKGSSIVVKLSVDKSKWWKIPYRYNPNTARRCLVLTLVFTFVYWVTYPSLDKLVEFFIFSANDKFATSPMTSFMVYIGYGDTLLGGDSGD